MSSWVNTLRNASRPSFLPVMAQKVVTRMKAREARRRREATIEWCTANAEDVAAYACGLDAGLWEEAVTFARHHQQSANAILRQLDVSLGGGAHAALLHFLVQYRRPRTIVETGVAAGFSSQAMLAALERNGAGMLHSSDFPYFRLKQPERYVGIVVDEALKGRWRLYMDGDRQNLEAILRVCGPIDLVHYDSDKFYAGRAYVMNRIRGHLAPDAMVIMDDIEDNTFFRNYVEATGAPARIFQYRHKFIGLIERIGAGGQ